jgi:hypothetical protein
MPKKVIAVKDVISAIETTSVDNLTSIVKANSPQELRSAVLATMVSANRITEEEKEDVVTAKGATVKYVENIQLAAVKYLKAIIETTNNKNDKNNK